MNNPLLKFLGIAVVVLLVLGGCSYNGMATGQEGVKQRIGDLNSTYQRRSDLIPNLVATVKGYAKHEHDTIVETVEKRAAATQITIDPAKLAENPQLLKETIARQGELSSALGRLIAIQENYPNLKADQGFLTLQAQLEGTENRINIARRDMNESINRYNGSVRRLPGSLFAGIFGFTPYDYYEATTPGADKAPTVKFP